MTEPTTIRDRISDAIIEIDHGHPKAARIDLVAALALLDNYPHVNYGPLSQPPEHYKIIPDPAPLDTAVQSLEGGPSMFEDETPRD